MSKLSRKEFRELLAEWCNNFINERVTPDLSSHISAPKQNFTIINVEEENPKFREELKKNNISFGWISEQIVQCNKNTNVIKEFIINNFTLDKDNKYLLDESYNKKTPILVSSSNFSGGLGEGQKNSKEECLHWLIHDLFHASFDRGRLGSAFLDNINTGDKEEYIEKYKSLLPNAIELNNIDLDDLMDYDEEFTKDIYSYEKEKKHVHIIPELVAYFKSINFTDGIESFDLIPSIFSYCMLKMPDPNDIVSLEFLLNTIKLSNEAKKYLLVFNIEAKKKFKDVVVPMFANKVSFLDLTQ